MNKCFMFVSSLLVILFMYGCNKNNTNSTQQVIYTDTTKVHNILSGVDDIESASWKEIPMGNSDVVGPTDYREIGYVKISKTKSNELLETYSFSEVSFEASEDDIDTSNLSNSKWMVNKNFTNDSLSKTYQGNIYFNGSYIWFDVITK